MKSLKLKSLHYTIGLDNQRSAILRITRKLILIILFASFSSNNLSHAQRILKFLEKGAEATSDANKLAKAGKIINKGTQIEKAKLFSNIGRVESGFEVADAAIYAFRTLDQDMKKPFAYIGSKGDKKTLSFTSNEKLFDLNSDNYDDLSKYINESLDINNDQYNLLIEDGVFEDKNFDLEKFSTKQKVYYVDPDGNPHKARIAFDGGKKKCFLRYEDNESLFYPLIDNSFMDQFNQLFTRSLSKEDINILGLIDKNADKYTADALKKIGDDNIVTASFFNNDLEDQFEKSEGKFLVLFGHTEGNDFVIRNAENQVSYQIPYQEVENLAKQHKTTVIKMGCYTGSGGYLDKIHSLTIDKQLNKALESKTFGDFFTSLGTPENPFVITHEQIDKSTFISLKRLEEKKDINKATIKTASILYLAEEVIPFTTRVAGIFLTALGYFFGIIVISLIISFFAGSIKPFTWVITTTFTILALPIYLAKSLINPSKEKSIPSE